MIEELLQRIETLERIVAMQASVIAQRDAEIVRLNGIISFQNEKIAKLEARLKSNSSNSSKPPSTDPPWKKKRSITSRPKMSEAVTSRHSFIWWLHIKLHQASTAWPKKNSVSTIAKRLGIAKRTLYRYLEKEPAANAASLRNFHLWRLVTASLILGLFG